MSDSQPTWVPFLFRYSTRQIKFAPGAALELGDVAAARDARSAVLVTDAFFAGSEALARIVQTLEKKRVATTVHAVPNHEPDTESVAACRGVLQAVQPELIVALGGGSTMDTAKVARILLSNPGDVAHMASFDRYFAPHDSLFVCIPTTAGTASEVSEMAVISKAGSDIKLRYRSQNMSAAIAILDPELLVSMPPQVTAHTGFDAFTHAFESYVSKLASPVTDPLARASLHRILKWLPIAHDEPDNLIARGECLIGSTLAGVVFNSTQLGLAHAISAPLGAMNHVIHGLGNALALPAVTAFNELELGDKHEALCTMLGTERVADGVARLRARLGLDQGLDDFVEGEKHAAIADAALKSGNITTNPRLPEHRDMMAILQAMRAPLKGESPHDRLRQAYAAG